MGAQETGRKGGSSRRDFLKKSVVAGAAVWAAPTVVSLPGGRAWAQTYGRCNCATDAYGLSVSVLGGAPIIFGPANAPAVLDTGTINAGLASVSAQVISSTATSSVDGPCAAHAEIAHLDFALTSPVPLAPPQLTIVSDTLVSDASANCDPCASMGTSSAEILQVGGSLVGGTITVDVSTSCNLDVAGLGLVIVNEQSCAANGELTVNALHIKVPSDGSIIDVIASHTTARADNCPCNTCGTV